ncbi:MAG: hypothetical protein ACREN4_10245 [Candidatus Dormibacteria bacterium]
MRPAPDELSWAQAWGDLDPAWQEAGAQGWEGLRAGDIPVGACLSDAGGEPVGPSRNRVCDQDGPPGEVFGSWLAHAGAHPQEDAA